ncbi:MAG: hypothetical protein HQK96_11455 [Nitrospirae bacterium]|nr:hypothetical protein [Nitrospirota bacterium]
MSQVIVRDVLGLDMTREIWSGNFEKALPISIQNFDLASVLPAVFYMFRRGFRRGKGNFLKTFGTTSGNSKEQPVTIERVTAKLLENNHFQGFDGETAQAILGDLLLCYCLENSKRELGRDKPIQRVAPAHYMASWVDLPDKVAHLRFVPESIVAILANQKGDFIQQNHEGDRTWFAVGRGFEDNVLLKVFHQGIVREGEMASLDSDRFVEDKPVSMDQLLMIRMAQKLLRAPEKLRGTERPTISNQRPISEKADGEFSEDMRRFIRAYAGIIPRHSFVDLLESCMSVGLITIISSVIEILFKWADTGEVPNKAEQKSASILIDCSNGVDRRLRTIAEQSMSDFMRRIERFPVVLMALRLLDFEARYDPKIKQMNIPTKPYATEWLNMLGKLLHKKNAGAEAIHYDLERKAQQLSEKLKKDYPDISQILSSEESLHNPVWRLAESLTSLQGRESTQANLIKLINSALLMGRPNGLASKRRIRYSDMLTSKKTREVRSLIFSDSVLDYLVHLHVLRSGNSSGVRSLSFKEFIDKLRTRYGFYVDVAPQGMTISNELLQANRVFLERRLRDLGLLVGVNDAEAMKRLHPRFEPVNGGENGMD